MQSVATQQTRIICNDGAASRQPAPAGPAVRNRKPGDAAKLFMLESGSDEDLMAQVASGDHAAFRILMARHMRRAIRVAQGVVRHQGEADDVAQDAFLRIWRHARAFDPARARFTTWMHRIVVNLAIDRARQPRTVPIEYASDVADGVPDPLASILESEKQAAIHAALAEMPERQRAAIALFHFEGLSGRESAQVLDLSEDAFESLLMRARAALKRRIGTATKNNGRET